MRKIDHHHCSGPGAQCDICGPDPRDAEIARLKAEVERAKVQPLPSNLDGYLAFRDMVCAALDIEPTWSSRPAEEIVRLRRALAAGPAAVRAMKPPTHYAAARVVEAAQAAAMKDDDKKGGG